MLSILVTKKTKMSHRQLKVSQLQKGRSPKQHSYPSQCIRNTVSEECALSKKRSRLWPWQKRSSLGFSNLIGRTTGQRTENWSSVSCEGVKYRLLPPSDAHRVYACDQQTSLRSKKVFFLAWELRTFEDLAHWWKWLRFYTHSQSSSSKASCFHAAFKHASLLLLLHPVYVPCTISTL